MTAGVGFILLFGLSFVLFSCQGKITSPPDGTKMYFLNGSTAKIIWSFNDDISGITSRVWYFTSSDGSINTRRLGRIIDDKTPEVDQASGLSGVKIIKPATLILKNVNQTYDGTYRFDIGSPAGGSSKVVVVIPTKPSVIINCSDPTRTINEGNDLTCVCRDEDGNPPANLTWFDKDGEQIVNTSYVENILTLTNVNKQHSGRYVCNGQSYTLTDEKSFELIVHYKPTYTTSKIPKQAYIGKEFTITCESDGLPAPNYTISHNGTIVSNESKYTKVAEDVDAGTYNCTAMNVLGRNSDSGYLNVIKGQITPKPTISSTTTSQAAPSTTSKGTVGTTPGNGGNGTNIGLIVGIIIGVLALLVIAGIVLYCYKSKEKDGRNRANIDPVPGNHYELEKEEPGQGDGAYDTVGPVGASGSKSKPPAGNTLPPVYAAVDKNNRQGNTLYASLDTEALQSSRASKKEPDRPPQAEYASIDFGKSAPKADLV